MKIQLFHHRSRKRFEKWAKSENIGFEFDGYGCGYYDPHYIIADTPIDWSMCPVQVWDEFENLLTSCSNAAQL